MKKRQFFPIQRFVVHRTQRDVVRMIFETITALAKLGSHAHARVLLNVVERRIATGSVKNPEMFEENGIWQVLSDKLNFLMYIAADKKSEALFLANEVMHRSGKISQFHPNDSFSEITLTGFVADVCNYSIEHLSTLSSVFH
jgi:hypothetical protein